MPRDQKAPRAFLGLASYFRRFIEGFANSAVTLHTLLRPNVAFVWGTAETQACDDSKASLASPPVLAHFNQKAPTEVHTDANGRGIGAVLIQHVAGAERVIARASRTLTHAE